MPETITIDAIRSLLPRRLRDSHKGSYGHVFVVAGSRRYLGAARLAGGGAARSGVGLVTLGVPGGIARDIAAASLETMTLGLGDAENFGAGQVDAALDFVAGIDGVVLGPGVGQAEESISFVREFVRACGKPLVVDADGLNAVAGELDAITSRSAATVLTPHPGEMARLVGKTNREVQTSRVDVAKDFAAEHGCVVVLKGAGTVVASPDGEVSINTTGNAGLASGGTGDVLAGLMGGLLAQGMTPYDAGRVAVFAHGLAGDLAADDLTERGMIAGDVIDYLPRAWKKIEGGKIS